MNFEDTVPKPGTREAGWHALATLYHNFFTGLILSISSRAGKEVAGEWAHNLFRRQHHEKFLSSFQKLGLSDLPHAVAAARYHYLSNRIGGVEVEYMEESERKAWVRFPHPRWIYMGTAICGVPDEVGLGFIKGWYAHNAVSLENPRLGYVCTSQDTHAAFGFVGYFEEHDHELAPDEHLRFAPDEIAPPFDPANAPELDPDIWTRERLIKARRNYAMAYVANGLIELIELIGEEKAQELGEFAARMIGRQFYRILQDILGRDPADTSAEAFAQFVQELAAAHDNPAEIIRDGAYIDITQQGWRLSRDMETVSGAIFESWNGLWEGFLNVHDRGCRLETIVRPDDAGGHIQWRVG